MNKFSVIIPTLWKSDRIFKLLEDLILCTLIDEIILIDNNKEFYQYFTEVNAKIKLIQPEHNLFVNPSWNLGIKIANCENIALLNDDINFDPIIFDLLISSNFINLGIIGMGQGNYEREQNTGTPYLEEWRPGMNDWGWGCALFFNKTLWVDIPEQLKIWCGDNYIKDINPCKKFVLRNFKIDTEMSSTSDLPEWDSVKNADRNMYERICFGIG